MFLKKLYEFWIWQEVSANIKFGIHCHLLRRRQVWIRCIITLSSATHILPHPSLSTSVFFKLKTLLLEQLCFCALDCGFVQWVNSWAQTITFPPRKSASLKVSIFHITVWSHCALTFLVIAIIITFIIIIIIIASSLHLPQCFWLFSLLSSSPPGSFQESGSQWSPTPPWTLIYHLKKGIPPSCIIRT